MDHMKILKGLEKKTISLAALSGIVAAGLVLGVAELASTFFSVRAAPLIALGSTFIDFTPSWLKDFAIATFGTGDKAALFVGMGLTIAILAAVLGIVAYRSWKLGVAGVIFMGLIMSAAVVSRAGTDIPDVIPSLLGTVTGLFALKWIIARLHSWKDTGTNGDTNESRRRFLLAIGATGIVAGITAAGGKVIGGIKENIRAARDGIVFPRPKSPAKAVPAGVQAPVEGTVSWLTPNDDFYRIDTALSVPQIDISDWELRVHGMVEEEFTMTFQDLLDADLIERHITLTCVSNPVGGNLVGNAKWSGYPLREVLKRAKPLPGADMVLSTSEDGFSASTPLSVLQDDRDAILAISMNDEPLPLEHGYPVRMVVPGLYGYVSATKWVVDIEVTRFADKKAYWTTRGWAEKGPIKTMARVDVPASFAKKPAGKVMIAGSSWSQQRGITKVEIQIDGGDWVETTLADEASVDTWRQWYHEVELEPGTHNVRARATDAKDGLQTDKRAETVPDGASGWQSVQFTVE